MGARQCCCPPKDGDADEVVLVPPAKVQVGKHGPEVKVKQDAHGALVSGHGVLLADTLIEQDAAYWEVRVLEVGNSNQCFVGVALELANQRLNSMIGDATSSWAVGGNLPGGPLQKNDVIGVAFGLGDIPNLRFYRNGQQIFEAEVLRIRQEVYPAVSVSDGAEVLMVFEGAGFAHEPPGRHTSVIPPRKMI
eukprot:TRINITY_DN32531_c0_g1_i1.p1 TRINITY_DN32531_c0_g1~~TRINITY_DN32531_c0_g1_i1.p1  ORF type:complete len:192 (+),score=30.45 TRINITY_DN32531_c0_g1_i1:65-640(+)